MNQLPTDLTIYHIAEFLADDQSALTGLLSIAHLQGTEQTQFAKNHYKNVLQDIIITGGTDIDKPLPLHLFDVVPPGSDIIDEAIEFYSKYPPYTNQRQVYRID